MDFKILITHFSPVLKETVFQRMDPDIVADTDLKLHLYSPEMEQKCPQVIKIGLFIVAFLPMLRYPFIFLD